MITISVSPYENTNDWEKFNEMPLPKKEDFYSHLNMGDITDADYAHTKRVLKFLLTKIRMIGKNSMKCHYLKKKIFIVT